MVWLVILCTHGEKVSHQATVGYQPPSQKYHIECRYGSGGAVISTDVDKSLVEIRSGGVMIYADAAHSRLLQGFTGSCSITSN